MDGAGMKFRKSKEERKEKAQKNARKWGSRAAHHPWAFTLGFTVSLSYYFIFLFIVIQSPHGILSWNVWVARVLIFFLIPSMFIFPKLLFGIIQAWRHNDNLCAICFGKFPLDPQAEVKKQDFYLRALHKLDDKQKIFFVPIVGVALSFPLAMIALPVGVIFDLNWMVYTSFGLFLYAGIGMSFLGVLNMTHIRLQPWCPYCDHRRDDDDEDAPILPEPVSGTN
jgi:hypothetical protein